MPGRVPRGLEGWCDRTRRWSPLAVFGVAVWVLPTAPAPPARAITAEAVLTVALSHRLWGQVGGISVVVDRLYYVSSGFNTEQAYGAFLPIADGDPGLLRQPDLDRPGDRIRLVGQARHR